MPRNQPRLRALATLIFTTPLVCAQAAQPADAPSREAIAPECRPALARTLLRGHGQLVASLEEATSCRLTEYEGVGTRLYTNRPYHTATRSEVLVGNVFCQAARHATRSWIIEVSQATQLLALGNDGHELTAKGWRRLGEEVRVEAAGVPFDAVYAKRFVPGRYLVRQDFSRTPPPVFWKMSTSASCASPR